MSTKVNDVLRLSLSAWLSAALVVAFVPSKSYSQLAKGRSKFVGNTINTPTSIESYFSQYWDQVTPENAGKWGSVQGSDTSSFNWTGVEDAYNYAISHNFPFKFHNLIWGNQQPQFMQKGVLDSAQQYDAISTWIDSVGHKFPKSAMCDVVNEPIHTPPNGVNNTADYIQALGGSGKTGWDWVIKAFELAKAAFPPTTKLLLNEYGIVNSTSTTAQYLQIIRLLQARGLIGGIGVQAHYFSVQGTPLSLIKQNLDSLASTGLPIYISEFDINEQSDQTQLQDYETYFPFLYQYPDVKGITIWGYKEYQTWVPYSYLITDRLTTRPALVWLEQYFASYLQTNLVSPVDTTDVPRNPLLAWNSSTAATTYQVQVATDSLFSNIVMDSSTVDTSIRLDTLAANSTYYWHVLATNSSDTGSYSDTASFTTGSIITGILDLAGIPSEFELDQNYPNPFNPTTTIGYQLPASSFVTLKIYDVLGRIVATLVNESQNAGPHEVVFSASNLPSGVYFYRITAGAHSAVKRLMLIK